MSNPYIAQIMPFGGNFAIRGWAKCDGQLLPISQYSALFSILGTMYGGDGRTTFGLPDLRGRACIHAGNGPGLSDYTVGEKGGVETVTLSVNQIPSHNHAATGHLKGSSQDGDEDEPSDSNTIAKSGNSSNIYKEATPDVAMNASTVTVTVNNTGGNQSHTNIQPYQAVTWLIALQGVYPSRN